MAIETTQNLTDETLGKINDLVRVNIDSSRGFKAAAETIENASIASLFREIAEERSAFGRELAGYVEMNDEEADDSGSISGAVHRWWLIARGAVSGGDDYAVLAEAERGEDQIKARYEEVLKEIPGSAMNRVLQDQYARVKHSHDRIRDMRDRAK